jgi:DNA-binding CsgD family transcriptional regulator
MELISANDFETLLDCIRELHSFRDVSVLLNWLLDTALPSLVPSDWLSYNEVDLLNPAKTLAILKPEPITLFEPLLGRFRELAHQNPLIARQMTATNFPVHKISDFISRDAFHQLELYQEVYRPLGVEYQIAATIRLEPNRVTAFALSRRESDYTERDRLILEMLRPHLVVAFNNLTLAADHKAWLDAATLALHELTSATLIVNPQGRILYYTGSGLEWIGATSPGVLPANIVEWLNPPAANGSRPPLRWPTVAGEIQIRSVPTSSPERRLLLTRANPRRSAAVAGLSQREREVAGWIHQGKSNAEIAGLLGISPRTVQKHVENMFTKLGVENRVAIATLVTE